MDSHVSLSKYHLIVLFLYILLVPAMLLLAPIDLNYSLRTENLGWGILIVVLLCLLCLAILAYRNVTASSLQAKSIFVTLLYATAFAIPEEILFRGIIQEVLSQEMLSPFWIVFTSSCIFGVAHILNGARGILPTQWNWKFVTMTFVAGIPLGTLYYVTGSLLLPTILHVIFILFLRFSRLR